MRAAREQERGCFVYGFAGPRNVKELELSADPASVARLLDFLEMTFNGGSDFNEPIRRCLDRLTEAEWANSDILIVSDGELRLPEEQMARKLRGAKDALGLRVHGVVLPAAATVRHASNAEVDTSVLRALCTNPVRGAREEVAVHVFQEWGALEEDVFAAEELCVQAAVDRGRLVEAWRQREIARLQEERENEKGGDRRLRAHPGAKYDKADKEARDKARRDAKLRAHPGMRYEKKES